VISLHPLPLVIVADFEAPRLLPDAPPVLAQAIGHYPPNSFQADEVVIVPIVSGPDIPAVAFLVAVTIRCEGAPGMLTTTETFWSQVSGANTWKM
jgi:hypothetical protein